MSEPKLISPLLDGFLMGAPLSDHDGVCCCPAMKENSDDKYIVKVISIPASQVQLDALLLTGAYKDSAAATAYFKELSDDVAAEVNVLRKLSKLEGFLPYEGCQVVPMEDNQLGYNVYLLSTYKQSLEKFMRRNAMTHLAAVNLGLDMCAALAICRNAGYLYVDLKPTNIFISEDKEYRIGDLGFVPMSSLKYASLPNKYCSPYSAPELHDPMSTLNTTADVYAAGMILYQVYNNGVLPFEGKAPAEPLPSPLNADYEVAEIIMKAVDPEPSNRWKNPMEMGQALVSYMQRNVINDDPINPPLATPEPMIAPEAESAETEDAPEQETEKVPEELSFMEEMVSDETAPEEEIVTELEDQEMSDEVSSMLAQADELIVQAEPEAETEAPAEETSQETEESAPAEETTEPKDNRSTMVISSSATSKFRFFEDDDEDDEEEEKDDEDEEDDEKSSGDMPELESPDAAPAKKKKKHTGLIVMLVLLVLLAGLAAGANYYYHNYYLLEVEGIKVDGHENTITVTIEGDIDTSLLTVVCSDSYGNTRRSTITDGVAYFADLNADTMYQIQLEVSGFHELKGATYGSYTTATKTEILNLSVITGNDDGSAVLSFSVDGPESDWNLICSTEDEEDRVITFTGHTVNITGLTVGKTYTLTLEPTSELYMTCENSIEFSASKIILAQNLQITDCSGGTLTAQWEAPEDAVVESWTVLCYNDAGDSFTMTTEDTSATFEGIDTTYAYTVEVTAAGMTQVVRTSITANTITITELSASESGSQDLIVTWEFEGNTPENGWLLMYTVDNSSAQEVVRTSTNSATISGRIPNATYHFTLLTADAATIFSNTADYTVSDVDLYYNRTQKLSFKFVTAHLVVTPRSNWTYKDVKSSNYTDTFQVGESISILLKVDSGTSFYVNKGQDISILYVVRDGSGNVIYELTNRETKDWYDMWWHTNGHYRSCELNLAEAPTTPGDYTLDIYFDGALAASADFTITE